MFQLCLFGPDEPVEMAAPEVQGIRILQRRFIAAAQLCLLCLKQGRHHCHYPVLTEPVTVRKRLVMFLRPVPRVIVTPETRWENRGGYSVGGPVRVEYGWRRVLLPFFNRNKKPWQI